MPEWQKFNLPSKRRASMDNVSILGIDLAKQSFQLHGAAADGSGVFRKKLSRPQLTAYLSELPRCVVAMEAALHPIIGA